MSDRYTIAAVRRVRLMCPRGHSCLELAVVELSDGLTFLCPADGLAKPEAASEFSELVDAACNRPPRGTSGWLRQSGDRIGVWDRAEVTVECPHGKCSYSGSFEYFGLSRDVGAAAVAGHAEYQLTE